MRLEDRNLPQDREQIDREHEAEIRRVMRESSNAFARHAAQAPRPATIAAVGTMYESTSLGGGPSAFTTSDGRYFASSEDCRRAQKDLDELDMLEAALTAAGDATARRLTLVKSDDHARDDRRPSTPRPRPVLVLHRGGIN